MTYSPFYTALSLSTSILFASLSPLSLAYDFIAPNVLNTTPVSASENSGVSAATLQRLQKVYHLMDTKQFSQAFETLNVLAQTARHAYEQAVVIKTAAFVYLQTDHPEHALKYFNLAFNMQALSAAEQQRILYNIAQLNLANQHYEQGISAFKQWLAEEEKHAQAIKASDYVYLAQAYQLNHQLTLARQTYEIAIKQALANHETVKEGWYQQLLNLNLEQARFQNSATLLTTLITLYPHKFTYWQRLAHVYEWQEQPKKALAVWELAYKNGLLTEPAPILKLTSLLQQLNYPLKAAKIMAESINRQYLPATAEYLAIQASAWQGAHEPITAIALYKQAHALDADAEYDQPLIHLLMQSRQWSSAVHVMTHMTPSKKDGAYYNLLGYLYYEMKEIKHSINAYKEAEAFADSKDEAQKWLTYLAQYDPNEGG